MGGKSSERALHLDILASLSEIATLGKDEGWIFSFPIDELECFQHGDALVWIFSFLRVVIFSCWSSISDTAGLHVFSLVFLKFPAQRRGIIFRQFSKNAIFFLFLLFVFFGAAVCGFRFVLQGRQASFSDYLLRSPSKHSFIIYSSAHIHRTPHLVVLGNLVSPHSRY